MSYLEQEIREQPDVLTRLLAAEVEKARALAEAVRGRKIQYIMVAARGTSDNAGRYGQYLFGAMNHLPVALAAPSLFSIYGTPPRFGDCLVLGISQSGQSPDIVSVLEEARRQGALTAVITNEPDSPLGRAGDHVISLHAGPERSVAATKTYTAELMAVALINAVLSGAPANLEALSAVAEAAAQTLELAPQVKRVAERYRFVDRLVVLGRGYNFANGLRDRAQAKRDELRRLRALFAGRFPARPVGDDRRKLPGDLRGALGRDAARNALRHGTRGRTRRRAAGDLRRRCGAGRGPAWLAPADGPA